MQLYYTARRDFRDAFSELEIFVQYWQDHRDFLNLITEQHDVSKHRSRILAGGSTRKDPPPGFFEKLGVPDDKSIRSEFHPMEEIILDAEPKTPVTKSPLVARKSWSYSVLAKTQNESWQL